MASFKGLVRYVGNKSKEIDTIVENMPQTQPITVVDVFGGSGCVGLNLSIRGGQTVVINDLQPNLVELYPILLDEDRRTEYFRRCKDIIDLMSVSSEEDNIELFEYHQTHATLESYTVLPLTSYSSMGHGFCAKALTMNLKPCTFSNRAKYLQKWEQKIDKSRVSFTCRDWKAVAEEYRHDPTAFLYMDPPYVTKKDINYHSGFTVKDIDEICEFMKSSECKVMLNLDFNGYVYVTFGSMIKHVYRNEYGISATRINKNYYQNYHCCICNYE